MATLGCKLKQLYRRLYITEKRRKTITTVLAICAIIFLSGLLSGLIVVTVRSLYQSSSSISSVGTLKAIGITVYRNQELTDIMTAIDWKTLDPGTVTTYTIYVSNEGIFL